MKHQLISPQITTACVQFHINTREDVAAFNRDAKKIIAEISRTRGLTSAEHVPFGCSLIPSLEPAGDGYILTGEKEFSTSPQQLPFIAHMWTHDYYECWIDPVE